VPPDICAYSDSSSTLDIALDAISTLNERIKAILKGDGIEDAYSQVTNMNRRVVYRSALAQRC